MPSASGGISRLLTARLRAAGIAPAPLLAQAGLTMAQIEDRKARVTVHSQISYLELGAAALGDDLLGFHLGRDCELRELGLLYYVLASSETLADALNKAVRYSGIVNEGVRLRWRDGREAGIGFHYVNVERRGDRQHIECWLTIIVRLARQLTNRRLIPGHVRVIHHGKKTPAELRSFLGCEIEFDAGVDEAVFSGDVLQMPVVGADMYLNDLLTRYCDEALTHRRDERVVTLRREIENAVVPLLPHGKASAVEIARRLGLSHRTLARRLAGEGLSFSRILHELKLDLATRYLREGFSVSSIAWLLGYQEVSAFTHAFKRWTGKSPKQLRLHEETGEIDIRRERRKRKGQRR
ncbi:MAG: AraC family transcriptional regulator [Bradyrhizobium sp.]|nr:AraC family transcriptional regulator [Bradyrhizobium sp.]